MDSEKGCLLSAAILVYIGLAQCRHLIHKGGATGKMITIQDTVLASCQGHFMCKVFPFRNSYGLTCLHAKHVCDGIPHCQDGSDEFPTHCSKKKSGTHGGGRFEIGHGKGIDIAGGELDIKDDGIDIAGGGKDFVDGGIDIIGDGFDIGAGGKYDLALGDAAPDYDIEEVLEEEPGKDIMFDSPLPLRRRIPPWRRPPPIFYPPPHAERPKFLLPPRRPQNDVVYDKPEYIDQLEPLPPKQIEKGIYHDSPNHDFGNELNKPRDSTYDVKYDSKYHQGHGQSTPHDYGSAANHDPHPSHPTEGAKYETNPQSSYHEQSPSQHVHHHSVVPAAAKQATIRDVVRLSNSQSPAVLPATSHMVPRASKYVESAVAVVPAPTVVQTPAEPAVVQNVEPAVSRQPTSVQAQAAPNVFHHHAPMVQRQPFAMQAPNVVNHIASMIQRPAFAMQAPAAPNVVHQLANMMQRQPFAMQAPNFVNHLAPMMQRQQIAMQAPAAPNVVRHVSPVVHALANSNTRALQIPSAASPRTAFVLQAPAAMMQRAPALLPRGAAVLSAPSPVISNSSPFLQALFPRTVVPSAAAAVVPQQQSLALPAAINMLQRPSSFFPASLPLSASLPGFPG